MVDWGDLDLDVNKVLERQEERARAQTQTRQRTLPYLSRDADRRGIPPWHVVSTTSLEAPALRMPAFPPSPVLLGP